MVDQYDEDDLFKDTSMTFGEHLEELRASLFKAVVALAIGFGIGLFFASWIVEGIQTPLYHALEAYYQEDAVEYLKEHLPAEMQDEATLKAVHKLVYEDGLLPEERYVSPIEMLDGLREKYPGKFADVELPAPSNGKAAAANVGGRVTSFSKDDLIRLFVWRPVSDDERLKLDTLSLQEPFVIYMKAGFLAGAVLSSPFVFFFLWQFVAAGLYPHEKRYVYTFLPFSVGLFLCGAAMAFFLVFPPVLGFFLSIGKALGTDMRPRLSEWLGFVLLLPLGFGISFQLPLVMLFLERIGVMTVESYWGMWKINFFLIHVFAAIISPSVDIISMEFLALPMFGLYVLGIYLCKLNPRPPEVGVDSPESDEPVEV
jgi:sec-independent protein translocase protein TatC